MSAGHPRGILLAPRGAPFLVEDGSVWTGTRILSLARQMEQAAQGRAANSPVVGVNSPSAGFILSAVLGLWQLGRQPLILDPGLRDLPSAVVERFPGMVQLTDRPECPGDAVVICEEAGTPLEPVWHAGDRTAALFLTSGSTGEPKVIRKRMDQISLQMDAELAFLGVPPELSVLSLAPPFHILGFVYGLFLPLLGGGRASFALGALPAQWARIIQRDRPTLVVGVPYHYRMLAGAARGALPDAFYFSSGAPLPREVDALFRERTGQVLTQGYGSTETGGIAKRTGFGPWCPFPGLRWRVEEDSRLAVRSPWQENPERWHVTDDIVALEGDGFTLLGRADSVVKVAGKRFSTEEVLAAARRVAGVGEAAAVTYQRYGENAVALFATRGPGSDLTPAELRRALTAELAPFKVPRTIEILEELPRLASGKVDHQALGGLVRTVR